MWNTERGAKMLQLGLLIAAGLVASRDIDRTMQQQPVTQEQQQQLQAWLRERKER